MLREESRPLATVAIRAAAFGFDFALFNAFRALLGLLALPEIELGSGGRLLTEGIVTVVYLFGYLCILPAATQGRTLGKLLLGIRIVRLDGQPLTVRNLFVRNWLGYIASGLLMGLGYLWAFGNARRQTWHDLALGTVVVQG